MKEKNKKQSYKVNVYLGKDNYILCKTLSEMLKVPLATVVKLVFEFGFNLTVKSDLTKEFFSNEQKRKK